MVWVLNKYFTGEFLVSDFLSCLFLVVNKNVQAMWSFLWLLRYVRWTKLHFCKTGTLNIIYWNYWSYFHSRNYKDSVSLGRRAAPGSAVSEPSVLGAAVPFCVPSNQPDHTLIGTTRTKEHNNHWTPLKITTKSVIIPWPTHALLSVSDRKGQNVKSHPNSFSFRSSDNLIKI